MIDPTLQAVITAICDSLERTAADGARLAGYLNVGEREAVLVSARSPSPALEIAAILARAQWRTNQREAILDATIHRVVITRILERSQASGKKYGG